MKFLIFLPFVIVIFLLRRRASWTEGSYRQQIDRWAEMESEIKPLRLPPVKPLKGVTHSRIWLPDAHTLPFRRHQG